MSRRYRILVLTDHSGHSDQNSIYAILSQLIIHPQCQYVDIASRGLKENDFFFQDMYAHAILGNRVDSSFKYSASGDAYRKGLKKLNREDYDIVLMRLPRPISDEFLLCLSDIFKHAIICNDPKGITITSNKKFLLHFPELCPSVRLCHSIAEIEEEIQKHPIVLKPLKEYGGRGLLKIDGDQLHDGEQFFDTLEYLTEMEDVIVKDGYLSMKFLKNVTEGDKRILVVGGEILASSLRLPPKGSWLCNVAKGGTSVASEVTPEEQNIITQINPRLKDEGILMYGVDTLVDDQGNRILSEINTLSIGGFPQAEAQTGKPVIQSLINKIFEYADERTAGYPTD